MTKRLVRVSLSLSKSYGSTVLHFSKLDNGTPQSLRLGHKLYSDIHLQSATTDITWNKLVKTDLRMLRQRLSALFMCVLLVGVGQKYLRISPSATQSVISPATVSSPLVECQHKRARPLRFAHVHKSGGTSFCQAAKENGEKVPLVDWTCNSEFGRIQLQSPDSAALRENSAT